MKYTAILLLFLSVYVSSCTTAYRNMQTPDDVYYSTGRPEGESLESNNPEYSDRMKSRDRRWRDIDEDYGYGCGYDPYHYGYNCSYYYNPHYYPYPVCWYAPVINSTPRTTNLSSYYNTSRTILNTKTGQSTILKSLDAFNNSNNNSRLIRSAGVFGSSSESSRTYNPSGGQSSSSSGSSIIRPTKN